MTELDLAAIKARYEAAAEGPWEAIPIWSEDLDENAIELRVACGRPERVGSHQAALFWTIREDEAIFCAHARTDIPALVAEVERLNAVRDECERQYQEKVQGVQMIRAEASEADSEWKTALSEMRACTWNGRNPGECDELERHLRQVRERVALSGEDA